MLIRRYARRINISMKDFKLFIKHIKRICDIAQLTMAGNEHSDRVTRLRNQNKIEWANLPKNQQDALNRISSEITLIRCETDVDIRLLRIIRDLRHKYNNQHTIIMISDSINGVFIQSIDKLNCEIIADIRRIAAPYDVVFRYGQIILN